MAAGLALTAWALGFSSSLSLSLDSEEEEEEELLLEDGGGAAFFLEDFSFLLSLTGSAGAAALEAFLLDLELLSAAAVFFTGSEAPLLASLVELFLGLSALLGLVETLVLPMLCNL